MKRDSEVRLHGIMPSGDLRLPRQSNPCLHGLITDFKLVMMMMMMLSDVIKKQSSQTGQYSGQKDG